MQSRHATTVCGGRNINEACTLINKACTLKRETFLNGETACLPIRIQRIWLDTASTEQRNAAAAQSEQPTYLGRNLGWKWKAYGSSSPAVMTTNVVTARVRSLEKNEFLSLNPEPTCIAFLRRRVGKCHRPFTASMT